SSSPRRELSRAENVGRNDVERNRLVDHVKVVTSIAKIEVDQVSTRDQGDIVKVTGDGSAPLDAVKLEAEDEPVVDAENGSPEIGLDHHAEYRLGRRSLDVNIHTDRERRSRAQGGDRALGPVAQGD